MYRLLLFIALSLACSFAGEPLTTKKGFGLSERKGRGLPYLESLNVGWYYNWGTMTKLESSAEFVPMLFSQRRLDAAISSPVVLGFNEPDHPKQARMSAEQTLQVWPQVVGKASRVGSPALAGNPLTSDWFAEFMRGNPKFDFITVHWYRGTDPQRFIADMKALHDRFGKPLWITEFAPQTHAGSVESPSRFTQAEVDHFIAECTRWMDATPWIERYAWHCSGIGTSALFDVEGSLTATGRTYAAAGLTHDALTKITAQSRTK